MHAVPRIQRSIGLLALGSWIALALLLVTAIINGPYMLAMYQWLMLLISVLGIVGGASWLTSRRRWKPLLMGAAILYVALMVVRFFVGSVWWQLEYGSLFEALSHALYSRWRPLVHLFAQGWVLEGISLTFYEVLMPVFQLAILVALMTSNSRLQADAPQASRA